MTEDEMTKLEKIRLEKGFSQRALAEKGDVSPATVYELENWRRKPNPSTLKKLAEALEVEVKQITEDKVEVKVEWQDQNDIRFAEKLRFTGRMLAAHNMGDLTYSLYQCPGGYRVYEEDAGDGLATLHPCDESEVEPYQRLYTGEEVIEQFPLFGDTLNIVPVRDID